MRTSRKTPWILCACLASGCQLVSGLDGLRTDTTASSSAGAGGAGGAGTSGSTTSGDTSSSTTSGSTASSSSSGEASSSSSSASSSSGAGGAPSDPCVEPGLIACYRFEGNLQDGSASGLHGFVVSGAPLYLPGKEGLAIDTSASAVQAPDSPLWEVSAATVEMWINADTLPTGAGRMGLFDAQVGYAIFLYPGGVVRCTMGGAAPVETTIVPGVWTHVACTWASVTPNVTDVAVYRDGVLQQSDKGNTFSTSVDGVGIGSNYGGAPDSFDGRIDTLRVFDVARTAQQICAAAGNGGC